MRTICLAGILCATALGAQDAPDLLQAARNNDVAVLQAAIAEGADPNVRSERGATPLMYAAAFGSLEAMKLLLDSGADAKAKDSFGASALVWAVGDAAKAKLLVERGAEVNLRTARGRTPLLVAAAHHGAASTVRLLLDRGADIKAADEIGNTALMLAAVANDFETVKVLLERGADAAEKNAKGYTPLMFAAAYDNTPMVMLLLSKGAPVNAANTEDDKVRFGDIELKLLTPLMLASPHGSVPTVRALLDAGAEVNARDSRGLTPLTFAVASETHDLGVIKLLLANGADVGAQSHAGEAALDWAQKYGNGRVIAALRKAGAKAASKPAEKPQRSGDPPSRPREAVERSLALLQTSSAEFFRQSGCVSCHHQNAAQMATAAARTAGVSFDEAAAEENSKSVKALWAMAEEALLERLDAPGSPDTPMISLFAMALDGQPADSVTRTLAAHLATLQLQDGSWRLMGFSRAPIEESHFARTAMGMRVLQVYSVPGRSREFEARIDRARLWLEKTRPKTTDDYVWRLLGLYWANANPGKVRSAARGLLKLQRADGGWAQNPHLESDAYGTGTALWALHTAAILKPGDRAYQKGVQYLLRTQLDDGSWYVRSRAPKFQPYFESGFPHGHDQWVSSMATAWATMALAPAAQAVAGRVTD